MPDSDPLRDLLQRTQPSLKQIFTRFRMPPDVVEELLEDCLMVLVYRHDQLAHPDRWLLRTVRFRCVRYWRKRRSDICRRGQREVLRWLYDEDCSEEERENRKKELLGHLARLPERCRQPLEELFQLRPPSGSGEIDLVTAGGLLSRGPHSAENQIIRCMSHLLRRLLEAPPPDLVDPRLL